MFRDDGHIAESSFDVASLFDRRDLSSAAAGSLSSPAAGPLYSGGTFLPRRWERWSFTAVELFFQGAGSVCPLTESWGPTPPLSEGLGS